MVILRLFTFLLKCAWSHLNCLSWQELDRESLIHEYVSFKLDHCNSLLYGLPAYIKNWTDCSHFKILLLELLLKPGNFIIFHWFCSLCWLPINGRIIFKILWFVYKILNGQLLNYRTFSRSLTCRSAVQNYLEAGKTNTACESYGDLPFSIVGPKLWNGLPLEVRQSANINVWKTHLFQQAYKFD